MTSVDPAACQLQRSNRVHCIYSAVSVSQGGRIAGGCVAGGRGAECGRARADGQDVKHQVKYADMKRKFLW